MPRRTRTFARSKRWFRGTRPATCRAIPVDESLRTKVLRFEVKLDAAALVRDYQKKRAKQLGQLIDDDMLIREVFRVALDRIVEQRREESRTTTDMVDAPPPSEAATQHDQADDSVTTKSRYQVSITTCSDCRRGWLDAAGTSTLLAPAELATALCDCDDIGRVDDAGPVARKRTSIPPARKRKVLARDRHRCQVPGCRSANIDVHHLHALALGGSHDEWNLITLCEAHHLAIHRGTLIATGRAPDVMFSFAAANRFTIESRVVETKRELERRGIEKRVASDAANAIRTHVGMQALSREEWLKLALANCASKGS